MVRFALYGALGRTFARELCESEDGDREKETGRVVVEMGLTTVVVCFSLV
jgi:hypothetical protein